MTGSTRSSPGSASAGAEPALFDFPPEKPWSLAPDEIAHRLDVDPRRGLSPAEAARRALRFGANRLPEPPTRGAVRIWLGQFRSLVAALLGAATAASLLSGHRVEGGAILAVLLLNSLVGFFTELRAVRSMEALRRFTRARAKVIRDGEPHELDAEELVPGDVVALEAGDLVPADLRLLEAARLECDESALTGESMPLAKSTPAVSSGAPLAERSGSLFSGTAVTRGSALGVVVATGAATELGRIAGLAEAAEPQRTPLERQLERLAGRLIGITLAVAAATVSVGAARGRNLLEMLEVGVALAVAAVPEGLPVVATLALARGAWRMAHRRVLVRRLSAVASLGAANIILTDKTGTLTENRLTAIRVVLAGREVAIEGLGLEATGRFLAADEPLDPRLSPDLTAALEIAALCNNAALRGDGVRAHGDPLEVALLVAAAKAGLRRPELLARLPERREEPFDPGLRAMATYHLDGERLRVAVKGAPETVLAASTLERIASRSVALTDERRAAWLARSSELAHAGLRLLALAEKSAAKVDEPPYRELEIVALVGLLDPPRHEVRESLALCRKAGVRVVMVTGDQTGTARAVARELDLLADGETTLEGRDLPAGELDADDRDRLAAIPVFARVEPEQKLRLIRLHQQRGDVVAMLGDGVNDAPALAQADIGVAMGRRGTQVAREAADLVLEDDSFASIVGAVRQGRIILSNLRRFALYLLSCNASEIVLVAGAAALGSTLPLLPLQILYLNLVTDVFPALALGFGEGDAHVMARPPSPAGEPLLAARHWRRIAAYALLLAATVLALLFVTLALFGWSEPRAVTVSFLALALGQLGHVFDMRGRGSRLLDNDVVRNPWVWGALALCLALLAAALYLPGLRQLLGTVDPGIAGWAAAVAAALAPLLVAQLHHVLAGRRAHRHRSRP